MRRKRLTLAHVKRDVPLNLMEAFVDLLANIGTSFVLMSLGVLLGWILFGDFAPSESQRGFRTLVTHFGRPTSSVPVNALVLIAANLRGKSKTLALADLVTLATMYDNKEMFLALRDQISEKSLKRALLTKTNLGGWIDGRSPVGKENGQKFVVFALGTRPISHLDAPFNEKERNLLYQRFGQRIEPSPVTS